MKKYSIYVVDDCAIRNKPFFEKLFGDVIGIEFYYKFCKNQEEFGAEELGSFDAVILDVNLRSNGWNLSLGDALEIVGKQCPVMLMSFCFGEAQTCEKIMESVRQISKVDLIQIMSLKFLDATDDPTNENLIAAQLGMWIAINTSKDVIE